ncbi:MAG: hypothetical protein V5B78_06420 [Desulfohalobiaceae bacterium]
MTYTVGLYSSTRSICTKCRVHYSKLASLSKGHSILSTNSAPEARAKKIKKQHSSGTDYKEDTTWWDWILGPLQALLGWLIETLIWLLNWLPGIDIPTGDALRVR